MNVAQALAAAAGMGLERLDAQLLLLQALGRPPGDRAWLIAHDTDALPMQAQSAFEAYCGRRAAGEPQAYIAGAKEFFGMELSVDPRVLVPRPDTETLAQWALDLLDRQETTGLAKARPSVLDLGTGSGAIALAIKKTRPDADVEATDVSADALAVARENARRLALAVTFRQAEWLDDIDGRYDLIVSNPPYIEADDPHLAALAHEPRGALAAGEDGLDDIRTIIRQAPAHLRSGGWLLLEHGWDQADRVRGLLAAAGFQSVTGHSDLAGIQRCSGGQWLELG